MGGHSNWETDRRICRQQRVSISTRFEHIVALFLVAVFFKKKAGFARGVSKLRFDLVDRRGNRQIGRRVCRQQTGLVSGTPRANRRLLATGRADASDKFCRLGGQNAARTGSEG